MKNINVSSPLLPSFEEFMELSKIAWDNKWLTNNGELHKRLEDELCDYLDVKYISLFSNGTLALITALQALNLKGEVITTPYTFTATANSVLWNNLKPVFVDIDPITMNLDYAEVEKAITKYTSAILPVHVYGEPCNNEKLNQIAERHGLKLIYDAAHAFNVRVNEESILNWGDCSILSFHATKTYSTIEGGAVVCNSLELKNKIDQLKNFGFESVESLPEVGINAKLNEIQCAFGLA
ncbi:DegT/DnrJ/EryC1/StrS family aminotransferase, partial [Photobacterium sanctipauli]